MDMEPTLHLASLDLLPGFLLKSAANGWRPEDVWKSNTAVCQTLSKLVGKTGCHQQFKFSKNDVEFHCCFVSEFHIG